MSPMKPTPSDPPAAAASESSTSLDPDSLSSSVPTLLDDIDTLRGDSIPPTRDSVRYTSTIVNAMSHQYMPPSKDIRLPFSPEELSHALDAVQVCA